MSRSGVARIVVGLAILGSLGYIGFVMLRVRDANQIPMLSTGFIVLGIAFAVVALWSLRTMWRAASAARGGRATGMAIVAGLAALASMGCFTLTALLTLVWTS